MSNRKCVFFIKLFVCFLYIHFVRIISQVVGKFFVHEINSCVCNFLNLDFPKFAQFCLRMFINIYEKPVFLVLVEFHAFIVDSKG